VVLAVDGAHDLRVGEAAGAAGAAGSADDAGGRADLVGRASRATRAKVAPLPAPSAAAMDRNAMVPSGARLGEGSRSPSG
jgi:hypothetical protein